MLLVSWCYLYLYLILNFDGLLVVLFPLVGWDVLEKRAPALNRNLPQYVETKRSPTDSPWRLSQDSDMGLCHY